MMPSTPKAPTDNGASPSPPSAVRNFGGLVGVRQQKENGSKWRMILSGGQCSRTAEKFGASGDAPSSLSACFSRLRFVATDFSQNGSEWRVASGEW
jgi:hypothetical protein